MEQATDGYDYEGNPYIVPGIVTSKTDEYKLKTAQDKTKIVKFRLGMAEGSYLASNSKGSSQYRITSMVELCSPNSHINKAGTPNDNAVIVLSDHEHEGPNSFNSEDDWNGTERHRICS